VTVEKVTDDVAVIAYKVREDLTVDWKELTLEAADERSGADSLAKMGTDYSTTAERI